MHLASNLTEKSELQRLKAELEAKAQKEFEEKLEEVNAYLAEQAKARERLDRIRDNNEIEIRKDFERMKKELLVSFTLLLLLLGSVIVCSVHLPAYKTKSLIFTAANSI